MDNSRLFSLQEPFSDYLAASDRSSYVDSLCHTGLDWWFEMQIPCLATHMAHLAAMPPETTDPKRLALLRELAKIALDETALARLHETFLAIGDREAASAAAGAGVAAVWDSGTNFRRFAPWVERIEALLADTTDLSPLAASSLCVYKGLAEMTWRGDLAAASESYRRQLAWAEKAKSPSLRVFHAASQCYCLIWGGHLGNADILFKDTEPLQALDDTSPVANVFFISSRALHSAVSGHPERGLETLEALFADPLTALLPNSVWLLAAAHALYAACVLGDEAVIEVWAGRVRDRAIPDQNAFHHSYLHFALGMAALALGRPQQALFHGEQAVERGRESDSPIAERMPAHLVGQALIDLGREDEAVGHLTSWIARWHVVGFDLLAASGCVELAYLRLRQNRLEDARENYREAHGLLPAGEAPPAFHRPLEFRSRLAHRLDPTTWQGLDAIDPGNYAVHVETLGSLRLRVGETVVYDRNWRGGSTKRLLKALIVEGGSKVPMELLADRLWPDAEGDVAKGNLKVTLSRLRRVGTAKGQEPVPWLVVRHGRISIVETLCAVDAILFHKTWPAAVQQGSLDLALATLALYRGTFLADDGEDTRVARHRGLLRGEFGSAVLAVAGLALEKNHGQSVIPHLRKAIANEQYREELYTALVRCHLQTGHAAGALEVFAEARKALKTGLCVEPGEVLTTLVREIIGTP